jgi:hypothetical protein
MERDVFDRRYGGATAAGSAKCGQVSLMGRGRPRVEALVGGGRSVGVRLAIFAAIASIAATFAAPSATAQSVKFSLRVAPNPAVLSTAGSGGGPMVDVSYVLSGQLGAAAVAFVDLYFQGNVSPCSSTTLGELSKVKRGEAGVGAFQEQIGDGGFVQGAFRLYGYDSFNKPGSYRVCAYLTRDTFTGEHDGPRIAGAAVILRVLTSSAGHAPRRAAASARLQALIPGSIRGDGGRCKPAAPQWLGNAEYLCWGSPDMPTTSYYVQYTLFPSRQALYRDYAEAFLPQVAHTSEGAGDCADFSAFSAPCEATWPVGGVTQGRVVEFMYEKDVPEVAWTVANVDLLVQIDGRDGAALLQWWKKLPPVWLDGSV